MKIVLDALTVIFEGKGIYPKIGLTVFKIWVVIFAFVGMQLSWNMRPFLGSKGMPFQLFRTETQGNFYSTVFSAFGTLLSGDQEKKQSNNDIENESNRDEALEHLLEG